MAQMSLGYRHLQGIGVPKSCQTGGCPGGCWAVKELGNVRVGVGWAGLGGVPKS